MLSVFLYFNAISFCFIKSKSPLGFTGTDNSISFNFDTVGLFSQLKLWFLNSVIISFNK